MEHFIIIRFSVKFNNTPEFKNKHNILFDKDKLDFRFKLFQEYCLPSITNQTLIDFKIIILYDENLPENYKNKLFNLVSSYNYIILHKWNIEDNISSCKWLEQYLPENYGFKYIITTRLDDDDMVKYDLNRIMKRYIRKFNCIGKIISFQGGFFLNYYNDNKKELVPIKYSSLAIFLTKIHTITDTNIYGHTHHNHNLPQRIIKTNNAFIVLNHQYENDNRLDRFSKKKGKVISLEEIYNIMKT